MGRTIAIGDIHGCNKPFRKLLFEELAITREDAIYVLGDYIDRGPDSKGVIDTLLALRADGYQLHTLRGNHEEMLMASVFGKENYAMWLNNGGRATLQSFNIKSFLELPPAYLDFFRDTKYFIQQEAFIFVHAGLNFTTPDIFQDKAAMLWIRDFHPQQNRLGKMTLVHGHTPKPLHYILAQQGNCINIDAGCVYSDIPGMGHLVALLLPERKFITVPNK